MTSLIPILLTALLGSAYALPSLRNSCNTQRIVGGYEINITEVPFQVALIESIGQYCGGSIISTHWILTAAHCVYPQEIPTLKVRVGSSHHSEGGQLIKVKQSIQHPKYNSVTLDYDFTLLELTEELHLTSDFYAVELPHRDEPVRDGTCLQVSGWGATQAPWTGDGLRATNVPAFNQDKCAKAYEDAQFQPVTARMICAGYESGGKGGCNGDSGGPLVDGSKLVGVVSWAKGCADPGFPVVYGRVAAVRDWIRETSGV